jgi:hypothetical protein
MSVAIVRSIARVSSATASATRPDRVYAAPKAPGHPGDKERQVHLLTYIHSSFELGESLVQAALAEGQEADPIGSPHETAGVGDCLSDLQPFFSESTALSE